ncbi:hypothetical protein [Flaviflexus equikiangi]|uniref:hypothetical protein n=1 Tax=Flaviflexus equikiangi TaxID=2758573 RepID=UPI0015F4FF80|nr:hypothetical protein [Flaviflexus equikiangi]
MDTMSNGAHWREGEAPYGVSGGWVGPAPYGQPGRSAASANDAGWHAPHPHQPPKPRRGLALAAAVSSAALAGGVGLGYVLFDSSSEQEAVLAERDCLRQNVLDSQAEVEARESDIAALEE